AVGRLGLRRSLFAVGRHGADRDLDLPDPGGGVVVRDQGEAAEGDADLHRQLVEPVTLRRWLRKLDRGAECRAFDAVLEGGAGDVEQARLWVLQPEAVAVADFEL